jgi:PAS domain S-box-containing protein
MDKPVAPPTQKEISCRVTRTLLMYVEKAENGSVKHLLEGLKLDEDYLSDPDNWVSHAFLQTLYHRMTDMLGDHHSVFHMALASGRFQSLGLLDPIVRLMGNPKMIYSRSPKYNKLLKLNGDVFIHDMGASWVILEDRYHDSAQKTRFDCDYTRGILAGIPTLFGMPQADIQEIECQVDPAAYGKRTWPDHPEQGCKGCLFRVKWSAKWGASFLRRFFQRRRLYDQAIEELQLANHKIQEKYNEVKRLSQNLEEANKELTDSKKQMETKQSQLMASESRYRLLAENVSDIIWTLRLDSLTFDYISPSVEKFRGFTPEEARQLSLEKTLSPDSLEHVTTLLSEELSSDTRTGVKPNRSITIEIEHSCKDGTYSVAEATVSFIRDSSGKPTKILGVSRDISERKKAEKQAAELTAQLHRAQKMEALGNLAAGVAHDLNNILSGIVCYPELILWELPDTSPLRKKVLAIQQSGNKAAAVVQDLLTLARRNVSVAEVVNLNGIITEFLASPEFNALRSHHPNVLIRDHLAVDLLNTKGSPIHLSKMVMNLLLNAVEAMPAGGHIWLSTQNVYLDVPVSGYERIPEGEYVLLTVNDEGVGLSPDDLKRIFEPFYTKKSMRRSGSGLGMTVIWATIKDHDGYVDMTSTEGEGTRFDIYLPATRKEISHNPQRVVLEDYVGNETILVVDDIEEQRLIAEKMLRKLGYQVVTVSSGEMAVEFLRARTVDLLVLDMIMQPGIDGLETYRRCIALTPDQKAIIVSGYAESDRVKALLQLGAGGYVRKPYTLEKLGVAVRRELDRVR